METENFYGVYEDVDALIASGCAELPTDGTVEDDAIRIADRALGEGVVSGSPPSSIAAAAVYGSARLHVTDEITQPRVCDVFGVCPAAIRNNYRRMLDAITTVDLGR